MVGQAIAAGTVQSQPASTPQAHPSWKDPQIHIKTANGKSASSYYDICDFVPNNIGEELVIGGQVDQQVVVKSGKKKTNLENLSLSQWSITNLAILLKLGGKIGWPCAHGLPFLFYCYQLIKNFISQTSIR